LLLTKSISKLLAKLLILLMFVTNPACIVAVHAATSTDNTATAQDDTTLTVAQSATGREAAVLTPQEDGMLTPREKELNFSNSLLNYYLKNGKGQGPQWMKTTDVQFSFVENQKPSYSLESLQPFGDVHKNGSLWFWQGRYAYDTNDGSAANFGLGWRKLISDKTSMIGLNAFYDYGFQYDLARIGVGTEYFNKLAEYRFNFYHPVSGDQLINSVAESDGLLNTYIRAVQGMDYEMGTALKHMPWIKFFIGGFCWNDQYNPTEEGYKARTTLQLTPRLQLELGYLHSNLSRNAYGQLTYNLANAYGPTAQGGVSLPNSGDVSYKLLQKVQRDNTIHTETYNKLQPYSGSTVVAVNDTSTSTAIVGATVTITAISTQASGIVAIAHGADTNGLTYTAVTDASGNATFTGIPEGTYTVVITAANYAPQTTTMMATPSGGTQQLNMTYNGATYAVTLPAATVGGTVTSTSTSPVVSGGSYSFKVTPNTGYVCNKVTVNGQTVTLNSNNQYTISNITQGQTVAVTFVNATTYAVTLPTGLTGGTITAASGSTSPVIYGGSYTFSVAPVAGYAIGTVTVNNTPISLTNNQYTISNITQAQTVAVTFVNATTYAVTLPTGLTGGTVTAASGSTSPVIYGGSYTFSVAPVAGYAIGTVTVNNTPISLTNNQYTISNITQAQTVAVTFVNATTYAVTLPFGLTGGTVTAAPGSTSPVIYGGSYTFSVAPATGYALHTATVNGVEIYLPGTQYTISNITQPQIVGATFVNTTTYAVTLPTGLTGGTVTAASGSNSPVIYGGSYTFSVVPVAGYAIGTVTVNSTPISLTNNQYTISNITQAQTVAVTFVNTTTYAVTLPTGLTGGTVTVASGSTSPVIYGGSYTFSVAPVAGYAIGPVTVNNTPISLTNNQYTIANIQQPQTVQATFCPLCYVYITNLDPNVSYIINVIDWNVGMIYSLDGLPTSSQITVPFIQGHSITVSIYNRNTQDQISPEYDFEAASINIQAPL